MFESLYKVWTLIQETFGDAWKWLLQTPYELWGGDLQDISNVVQGQMDELLANVSSGNLSDAIGSVFSYTLLGVWDAVVQVPIYFLKFYDYPLIALLFGGGLIFCIVWRFIAWIIDIFP